MADDRKTRSRRKAAGASKAGAPAAEAKKPRARAAARTGNPAGEEAGQKRPARKKPEAAEAHPSAGKRASAEHTGNRKRLAGAKPAEARKRPAGDPAGRRVNAGGKPRRNPAAGAAKAKRVRTKALAEAGEDMFLDMPAKASGGKRKGSQGAKHTGNRRSRAEGKSPKKAAHTGKAKKQVPKKPPMPPRQLALLASLSVLFAAGILCLSMLGVKQVQAHDRFLEMKQVVESQTFYAGTTVEGVDVSSLTLADAKEYWKNKVEPTYSGRTVTLDDGTQMTAAELGYTSDYESVLTGAWSAGRAGSLEQRYQAALKRFDNPVAYRVHRTLYDDRAVANLVGTMAASINRPAQDAQISSFDMTTFKFSFTQEETGAELDMAGLKRDIEVALESGGGIVTRQIRELKPASTAKEMESQYGLITSAITNASSSSSNRLSNIKQAMAYINGCCLEPGETFSFNGVVGRRTRDRGFKVATAYSGGEVTEELGGGICQVSTTLFNAAVKSDLKIVERHNHSLTVGYVDSGKDATVNWDSQDLKFQNTTGDKLYICCYLTGDKRVRFGIFGKKLANGETITVEARTTETIKYDTVYEPSASLATGQTQVVSNGKNGCRAVAYKIRWDANGNEISREELCRSSYRAKNKVVAYGT